MIKLAAFDVDGTLRDRDYLPESARQALHQLKAHGIEVVLCTGRSEFELKELRAELDIEWALTCNGSHIANKHKQLLNVGFPKATIYRWLQDANLWNHTFLLYGSELMLTNKLDDPLFRQAQQEIGFMEPVLLKRIEEVPDIFQCIVFCNEQDEQRYTKGEPFHIHRWRTWAVDLNPFGMNKATGLNRLADHLGIAMNEIAAFGDGLNDLEMLEAVGTGIAMGNACNELKAKAQFVTRSLHEDGIAHAVDWILTNQIHLQK